MSWSSGRPALAFAQTPPSMPVMGWSPPYHDQGRDKFTSVAQNAFKVVREAVVLALDLPGGKQLAGYLATDIADPAAIPFMINLLEHKDVATREAAAEDHFHDEAAADVGEQQHDETGERHGHEVRHHPAAGLLDR